MHGSKSPLFSLALMAAAATSHAAGKIVDHRHAVLSQIPLTAITQAKDSLHIAYGHTSHGSQLLSGNGYGSAGLNKVRGVSDVFTTSSDGAPGTLHLLEGSGYTEGGDLVGDAGWDHPSVDNRLRFVSETRKFLGTPNARGRGSNNPRYNVVMWSWCGQVSTHGEETWSHYLVGMDSLEKEYPGVAFVYMTGHLDGTGKTGQLHRRNEEIRAFARSHGKWLYDFADIESYNPDGREFLSLGANDNGDYDADSNGQLDSNWAMSWTGDHLRLVNRDIVAAHTQPLVGQLKTTAAWWLFASLAGWSGPADPVSVTSPTRPSATKTKGVENDLLGRPDRKFLFLGR
jgi:hypothetical protein